MITSPGTMAPSAGDVVAGKYRLDRLLAEGAMGTIFEATHLQLDRRVALKFMRASIVEQPVAVARFLREARAAARIQSDFVARVFDVDTLDDGSPYLVMEYLEGQDLENLLRWSGSLPIEQAVEYAVQACVGLAEAHAKGVVHRDLKPGNLFLTRTSDGSVRVKLLDFGISKLIPSGGAVDVSMTCTQAVMGTPLYMSPEQLRSSTNVDRRTDLWSMGVILYEMIGGVPPFDGSTLPEVCARVMTEKPPPLALGTKGLAAVVMRCLEKEAARRFPDAGALARALAAFGSPEARVMADRIVRLAHKSEPSITWTGVKGAVASGTRWWPYAMILGAAAGAAVATGVVALRHAHSQIAPREASTQVTAPEAVRPPRPVPGVAPSATPSADVPVVGAAPQATTASSAATPAATPPATSRATRPSRPRWRPATVTTARPSAAPAVPRSSTDGFGGRD